jgi:hypothetical protein
LIIFIFVAAGWVMLSLEVFIRQENISLYRKLLAGGNITDVQRGVIGKMLAEEEAKLLDLFSPQGPPGLVPIENP